MSSKKHISVPSNQHLQQIYALVQNPACKRLFSHTPNLFTQSKAWKPRSHFLQWASNNENMKKLFSEIYPNDDIRPIKDVLPNLPGHYTTTINLPFQLKDLHFSLKPDAVIFHLHRPKIIEFCCTADRRGKTNPFSLSKSRLRAAIHSHALHPASPAKTAFFVLHQWNSLTIHELSIAQELDIIQEAVSQTTQQYSHEYRFQRTCRFSCPLFSQCRKQAQKKGNPQVWSSSLSNIVSADVHKTPGLCHETSSRLSSIAHMYHRVFPQSSQNMEIK